LAGAQAALQWRQYQANGVEYLEYSTVGDDRVRPEHAALDGFVAHISDERWATIAPPNGFNCRCTLIPASANAALSPEPAEGSNGRPRPNPPANANWEKDYNISKYFQHNPGQTKAIFDEEMPVYKIGKKGPKQLLAIDHYGMRSVQQILDTEDWPAPQGFQTNRQAMQWFAQLAKGKKSVPLPTKTGFEVLLPQTAVEHILNDNTDGRQAFIAELPQVLSSPDEVWSTRLKNKVTFVFLKYYQGSPIVVRVNPMLKVFTMHNLLKNGRLNNDQAIALRKGILVYRK
jgi:hypothetical protein